MFLGTGSTSIQTGCDLCQNIHHSDLSVPPFSNQKITLPSCIPSCLPTSLMDFSPSQLLAMYVSNLPWNLFLTSTALHAIALITSPLQAVYKWWRRQSSDSDTCVPYICAVIGSSLWWRYSVFLRDTKLILLQSYALFMQCFFLVSLLYYRSKKRRLTRLVSAVILALLALFYYVGNMSEEDGKELMGQMASTAQIAGSFVCPWLIYKAVTSRCIDFVPMAPVAFTWVMEIHAIIYSVGIDDFYMMLANTIFFCMDGSLLSMFFIFPREKPEKTNVLVH